MTCYDEIFRHNSTGQRPIFRPITPDLVECFASVTACIPKVLLRYVTNASALDDPVFEPAAFHPSARTAFKAVERASPLHPHPLADADTLRCKLAKASLLGEGQGEGRFPRLIAPSSVTEAPMRFRGGQCSGTVRKIGSPHFCPSYPGRPRDDAGRLKPIAIGMSRPGVNCLRIRPSNPAFRKL